MKTLKKKTKLKPWVKVVIFYIVLALVVYGLTFIIKNPIDKPKGSIKILEIVKK